MWIVYWCSSHIRCCDNETFSATLSTSEWQSSSFFYQSVAIFDQTRHPERVYKPANSRETKREEIQYSPYRPVQVEMMGTDYTKRNPQNISVVQIPFARGSKRDLLVGTFNKNRKSEPVNDPTDSCIPESEEIEDSEFRSS